MATTNDSKGKDRYGLRMVWVLNKILEIGKVPRSEMLSTAPNSKGKLQAKELVLEAIMPKSFLFFKQKLKISIEPIKVAEFNKMIKEPIKDKNADAIHFQNGECLVKVTVKDLFKTKYSIMLSGQLIDALKAGRMLDEKLQLKLDILFGGKSISNIGNKIVIE